jgi:phosphatidylserine synthase
MLFVVSVLLASDLSLSSCWYHSTMNAIVNGKPILLYIFCFYLYICLDLSDFGVKAGSKGKEFFRGLCAECVFLKLLSHCCHLAACHCHSESH